MKKNILAFSLLSFLFFSFNTYAGTDPIGWSLSPAGGFPAASQLGNSYAVIYTLTNNLPFAVPLTVTADYTGGAFVITNGCNTTLGPKANCLVHLGFQPIKAGTSSIQLTMVYHRNRVPLPRLSSSATTNETADKISGHVTMPLPPVTFTGTSYPVEFSFVNNGLSTVQATSVNISGFTANTNTCLAPLAPDTAPCTVSGTFAPTSTGAANLAVKYNYNSGGVQSVYLSTQTNVQNGSGPCHHVNGQVTLPLPVSTFIYSDNVVKFTFTNHCDFNSETLGTVSITADGQATITKGNDTCSGRTIAANGSCFVFASIVPTAVNADLSVTAAAPYNGNTLTASATTSTTVNAIPNQASLHTVMFVNQCDKNVWYEFANGTGGVNSPDPTPTNQRTYLDYQLPMALTGAAPSTKVLSFSEYINGNIYGRTKCHFSAGYCDTASCPIIAANNWACQPGKGVTGPATLLEEFMPNAVNADGVYDVTVINGLNVPAEMKSLAPLSSNTFGCGQAAGALIQPTGSTLGACSWSFTPPSTGIDNPANFTWVSAGADTACPSSSSCSTGEYCGTAYNSVTAVNGGLPPLNRRCGTFLGYWQVGDYIVYPNSSDWGSVNLYNNYTLNATLINGPDGPYGTLFGRAVNYGDIYTCPIRTSNGSLNTGYNAGNKNVCGCHQWSFTASSTPCQEDNSDWESIVYPRIAWIKQACPTAYTYQFDDKSVSFTCQIPQQKTSYQITYCPGGKTGAPGT